MIPAPRDHLRTLSGPLPLVSDVVTERVVCPACGHDTLVREGVLSLHGPPQDPSTNCPASGTDPYYPTATEDVVVTHPDGSWETRLANGLTREERVEYQRLEKLGVEITSEAAATLLALYNKMEDFKKSPEYRRNKARRERRRNQ